MNKIFSKIFIILCFITFLFLISCSSNSQDNKTNGNAGIVDVSGPGNSIGWIGGGSNGWKTGIATNYAGDYQSFDYPQGVYVDSSGNIFVADRANERVCKWDSSGNAIGWIGGGSNGWKTSNASVSTLGSDYKSFQNPNSVFVDSSGNIYVADRGNERICKWDRNGNAIGWIGGGSNGWKTTNAILTYGTDYKSFADPDDVYVDGSGNIYISEAINNRISKWDSNGNAIGWIGGGSNGWKTGSAPSAGTDYKSFYNPFGVYVESSGNIYVADCINLRVSKWDGNGNAIGWIGGGSNGWKTSSAPANDDNDYQSLYYPYGVFCDNSGNIYVTDEHNCRISKWNSNGNAIGWIGEASNGWTL